jgi:hypothetical protein
MAMRSDIESGSPRRAWWYSFWFSVLAIVLGVGGIALAAYLLIWALVGNPDWQ